MPRPTKLEQALHLLLSEAGFEFQPYKRIGEFYADALVKSHGLIFEADGSYWHNRPGRRQRDIRRDAELLRLGYVVIRMDEEDLRPWLL